jgi:hypothetical protein
VLFRPIHDYDNRRRRPDLKEEEANSSRKENIRKQVEVFMSISDVESGDTVGVAVDAMAMSQD